MHKCSFKGCKKQLDPAKREVFSIRLIKGYVKLPNGKKVPDWEGYRFFCKEHNDLIFRKRLPRTNELVYGRKPKPVQVKPNESRKEN